MKQNRQTILKQLSPVTTNLLHEKGYISFVDVFMSLGILSKEDYENWRFMKVPYLEKVIKVNLAQINLIMRTIQKNSKNGGLKSSKTVYKSWGKKGPKKLLRFSKSADPNIEEAYSTHFLKPKEKPQNK